MTAAARTLPRRFREAPRRRAEEIVSAAAEVFAERGYHGASTQDIADRLGIRQASLYYYFPSKEVALETVCIRGVEGFVDQAALTAASSGTAADRVRRLIRGHLAPLLDRHAFVQVFLRERQNLPDASRRRVGRLSRRYERIVQEILAGGVASGEFRTDLDCRLAALALLGLCNGVPAWYGKEPDASLDRIVDEFAKLVLDGLQGAEGARRRPAARKPRARPRINRRID